MSNEAEGYIKAGDKAHAEGRVNSAEMFYDMAARQSSDSQHSGGRADSNDNANKQRR